MRVPPPQGGGGGGASGRLPEAKNNRKIQIIGVESGRGRFREVWTLVI